MIQKGGFYTSRLLPFINHLLAAKEYGVVKNQLSIDEYDS